MKQFTLMVLLIITSEFISNTVGVCSSLSRNDGRVNKSTLLTSKLKDIDKIDAGLKIGDSQNLIGVWILKGDKNPAFEIRKSTIYYPDHFKSYKYRVVNDSIKITFDDFEQSFPFKFKGNDILILEGDDGEQIYYRSKK